MEKITHCTGEWKYRLYKSRFNNICVKFIKLLASFVGKNDYWTKTIYNIPI